MKKYFFILSIFAILATVACDTSSKGTVSQVAPTTQAETVATPVPIATDSAVTLKPDKTRMSKKERMQHAEMAPMNKAEMLRRSDDNKPVKNN
jgi:hypothetical protein